MEARLLFAQAMATSVDHMVQDPSGDRQLLQGRVEAFPPPVEENREGVESDVHEEGAEDREEGV